MKRSKFAESQIIFALKGAEKGITVEEVGRKMGIWMRMRELAQVHGCGPDHGSNPSELSADNSFIESFNGSLRNECLNTNWFLSLDNARDKTES